MANLEKYIEDCKRTESIDFDAVSKRLGGEYADNPTSRMKVRLLHAVMGIVTEAGELMDQIKKHAYYGKELDLTNVVEEMGDLMWYSSIAFDAMSEVHGENVDGAALWGHALELNIAKLRARYPEKFNSEDAINRDLDAERKVLEEGVTK